MVKDFRPGDDHADRMPIPRGLTDRDKVRHDTVMLVAPHGCAHTSKAGLDLVSNEKASCGSDLANNRREIAIWHIQHTIAHE